MTRGRDLILKRLNTGEAGWVPLVTEAELLPYRNQERRFWFTVRLEEDHVNYQFKVQDEKAEDVAIRFILDGGYTSICSSYG
jgi:hypothetical protein